MKQPVSKAKTAYGLLSDIAKLTLAEPRRMRMGQWIISPDYFVPDERPKCGTIGCIGGWTETLRPDVVAGVTLGLSPIQADQLFFPNKLCSEGRQGTRRHALHVVRHIRNFQKRYRAQLLAKRV